MNFCPNCPAELEAEELLALIMLASVWIAGVDSLSVQSALAQLDPNVRQSTLDAILAAASSKQSLATIGAQGQAEGDTLEKIVQSLAAMLGVKIQPMAASLEGGTWANEADRAVLHENLQAIAGSIIDLGVQGAPSACRRRRVIKSIAADARTPGAEGRKCSRIWSRRHA